MVKGQIKLQEEAARRLDKRIANAERRKDVGGQGRRDGRDRKVLGDWPK